MRMLMGVVVKVKKGGERRVVFEYARPFIISIRVFWLVKKELWLAKLP